MMKFRKSSFSVESSCVEVGVRFRKSSYSTVGNCVEAGVIDGATLDGAPAGAVVAVRDSKDPGGPVLYFTGPEWDAFLRGVIAGEFTLDRLRT